METRTISRDRLERPPGELYTKTVLEPGFRFMLDHYFYPLAEVNQAWLVMLIQTGIVPEDRGARLLTAIVELEAVGPSAVGPFDPRYEYFYSHVEAELIRRVGEDIAGDINLARTRPEPLTRLVLRGRLLDLVEDIVTLAQTLLDVAEREVETVMPQWTHFQHAQLSTMGHYLVGIVSALERDIERLAAAYRTTNKCTLGCGALAGTSYPIDRVLVAQLLGFDGVRENTIDAVSGGDYVLETTAAVANLMVTLSRLCQDLYIWHTEEFGFVAVADEFAGSSSMMPQKKNAYPFEHVRARAAHSIGDSVAAFGTLHNTNYQDNKDVEEEIVPPALRSIEDASSSLRLLSGTIASMEIRRERMLERAGASFGACTELAAAIQRGTDLSYRTAHRIVGNMVLRASKQGRDAREVDAEQLNASAREIIGHDLDGIDDAQVCWALDPLAFVETHATYGGPATAVVREAVVAARGRLSENGRLVTGRARIALEEARSQLENLVNQRRTDVA